MLCTIPKSLSHIDTRRIGHSKTGLRALICAFVILVDCWNPCAFCEGPESYPVKWRTAIGNSSGPPVVTNELVVIGTNNDTRRDSKILEDCGVIMVFDRKSGTLRGQIVHERMARRANDLPGQGIRCTPVIVGNRVYYYDNRAELVCANLSTLTQERHRGEVRSSVAEPLFHWKLDLIGKLGVFKRDAGDIGNPLPSPVIGGDLVFLVTGNGSTFGYDIPGVDYVPKPEAPSFVAVNKNTGSVVWSSNLPGKNILYGQWASPALANVAGVDQVVFPGGDGWLYGFEAKNGKMVWKVDCNDVSSTKWISGKRGTRCSFLAKPVVRDHLLFIGTGADAEIGKGMRRPIYAVDLRQKGDCTKEAVRWTFVDDKLGGILGAVATGKDALYALGESGILVCLDCSSGKELWSRDLGSYAALFGYPVIAHGKVFVPVDDKVFVYEDSRTPNPLGHYGFEEPIVATPAIVGEHMYVATRGFLYCLKLD